MKITRQHMGGYLAVLVLLAGTIAYTTTDNLLWAIGGLLAALALIIATDGSDAT